MDDTRLRYLDAMQIPVWVPRLGAVPDQGADSGLRIGPGSSPVLMLCSDAECSATVLAADLARTIGGSPAWAWPEPDATDRIEAAVTERLLTAVVVFGPDLARRVFEGGTPATVGTARVLVLPAMEALLGDPQARRQCWKLLREAGLAAVK